MSAWLETTPVDCEFYAARLADFLPADLLDIHCHIWRAAQDGGADGGPDRDPRLASWPARVAAQNPIQDLLETCRLMLPGKRVMPLVFGNPTAREGIASQNRYVLAAAARRRLPALILTTPAWSAEVLAEQLQGPNCVGVKPYLSFAPSGLSADEVRVFDFLPRHHLEALDRRGSLVILHLPRPGRLKDPANLADMLEIEQQFPRVKLVIAHVGRAYCDEDIGSAFEALKRSERICFDISANTNEIVFRRLIRAVGPGRILFGSDLPITRMRMRRICERGRYVNLVPPRLYGDVSNDPHMREVSAEEGRRLTFFLYEEMDAFRRAAEAERLTRGEVADVFSRNAERLLQGWAHGDRKAGKGVKP